MCVLHTINNMAWWCNWSWVSEWGRESKITRTHSLYCFNIIELLVYTKNLTNAHRTPLEHTRTLLEHTRTPLELH